MGYTSFQDRKSAKTLLAIFAKKNSILDAPSGFQYASSMIDLKKYANLILDRDHYVQLAHHLKYLKTSVDVNSISSQLRYTVIANASNASANSLYIANKNYQFLQ